MNFKPAKGYVLIDPLEKVEKSDFVHVQDNVDDPHMGTVVAVGDSTYYSNTQIEYSCPVGVGDISFVLTSATKSIGQR